MHTVCFIERKLSFIALHPFKRDPFKKWLSDGYFYTIVMSFIDAIGLVSNIN
jgi:hypothetical protein